MGIGRPWEKRTGGNKLEKGGRGMAGKIFYRERGKVGKGEKKPRFRLVAVANLDMKVYGKHLRKSELEQIAKAVGAKLILLKGGEGKHKRREDVEIEE
jgi:hypothetical protein